MTAPNGYFRNFFSAFVRSDLVRHIEYRLFIDLEETTVTFTPINSPEIGPIVFSELMDLFDK